VLRAKPAPADRAPGPRCPVTFRDLYLRQYVVAPASPAAQLG
jgi:glutamate-5-semialdehyde dehydrogenase